MGTKLFLLERKLKKEFGKDLVSRRGDGILVSFVWDENFHTDEMYGPTEHEECAWVQAIESGFSVAFNRFWWCVKALARNGKMNSVTDVIGFIKETLKQ